MTTLILESSIYPGLRNVLPQVQELIQPESLFLQRLSKISRFSIENFFVTGKEIVQAFQQPRHIYVRAYSTQNDFQDAIGYIKEDEFIDARGAAVYINGTHFEKQIEEPEKKQEAIAMIIQMVVLSILIQSKGSFFTMIGSSPESISTPAKYYLSQMSDRVKILIGEPYAYGTFIFHDVPGREKPDSVGYEVSRDVLYKFILKEVKKEFSSCCFSWF